MLVQPENGNTSEVAVVKSASTVVGGDVTVAIVGVPIAVGVGELPTSSEEVVDVGSSTVVVSVTVVVVVGGAVVVVGDVVGDVVAVSVGVEVVATGVVSVGVEVVATGVVSVGVEVVVTGVVSVGVEVVATGVVSVGVVIDEAVMVDWFVVVIIPPVVVLAISVDVGGSGVVELVGSSVVDCPGAPPGEVCRCVLFCPLPLLSLLPLLLPVLLRFVFSLRSWEREMVRVTFILRASTNSGSMLKKVTARKNKNMTFGDIGKFGDICC